MTFDHEYHRWNMTHAAVLTAIAVVSLLVETGCSLALVQGAGGLTLCGWLGGLTPDGWLGGLPWFAAAIWAAIAMPRLYAIGRRTLPSEIGSPLPNLLTAVRAAAAIGLFILVGLGDLALTGRRGAADAGPASGGMLGASTGVAYPPGLVAWALVATLALVELTDFFDGRIARRRGPSVFGATWDMECDALFTLALSVTAHRLYRVGVFVLAIGLMRYVNVLIWRYDGDPPRYPPAFKLYAKTTAAAIVVTLIATMAPVVGQRLRAGSLLVVLVMQVVSFGWEILLHRRAGGAGGATGDPPET